MSEEIEIVDYEEDSIELEVDYDDIVSARDAEAWAVGQRGGVDVAPDDPTYQNNAKYYTQFAEEKADEAISRIDTAAEEIETDTLFIIEDNARRARESIPEEYTALSDDVQRVKKELLLMEDIPNTMQTLTRNADGKVVGIVHTSTGEGGGTVRTDAFTFADESVTETRTLDSGESLTITVNKLTKQTTVVYAD